MKLLDNTTREHFSKYQKMTNDIGLLLESEFLDYSTEQWVELFLKDPNLNNVDMHIWDSRAIILREYHKKEITSLCEGVCVLKHAVIYQIIKATPAYKF